MFFLFGWWVQLYIIYIYVLFLPLFGEDSHFDEYVFKGVETSNQLFVDAFFYGIHHWSDIFFL